MSIQIIKKGSEFKPHMAVTHMSPDINDGCATGENTPLVLKSKMDGDKLNTILKALGENSDILEKASYNNLRSMLRVVLEDKIKANNPTKEYFYVDVEDFDESSVVFYFDDNTYSIAYQVNTEGVIELVGEASKVVRTTVYTSVETNSLVLKGTKVEETLEEVLDEDTNLETIEDSEVKKENLGDEEVTEVVKMASGQNDNEIKESIMSDKEVVIDPQELVKSAVAEAKLQWEADAAEAVLVKSTTEAVKAFDFVDEADVATIVKCLVKDTGAEVILKALESANAKVEAANAEMLVIKEKFASQEQVADESTPTVEKSSASDILKANIAKAKATKAAASK